MFALLFIDHGKQGFHKCLTAKPTSVKFYAALSLMKAIVFLIIKDSEWLSRGHPYVPDIFHLYNVP